MIISIMLLPMVPFKDDDGEYINDFTSEEDLTAHLLYVLTLEPDDVLEGEF